MNATQVALDAPESNDGRYWGGKCVLALLGVALAAFLLPVNFSADASVREDSVRLNFQKTAASRKTRVYTVKKGDFLSGIFRSQRGDEPVPYNLIRQLNPGIKDLNLIYPGQSILLPLRDTIGIPESTDAISRESNAPQRTYAVRDGDSISRIILGELQASTEEVVPIYRLLRRLNPDVTDMSRLRTGQTLTLPIIRQARPVMESMPGAQPPEDVTPDQSLRTPPPTAEGLLGYVRPVISRMKGAITVVGSYFIPLKDSAQVTIDCSLIPVVEFDDGSTILLDYGDRLSDALKGLISQSWPNYAFLSAEELRNSLISLQSIIGHSRNYTMTHPEKPVTLTANPEILVFADWIISAKTAAGSSLYRQALFLLDGNEKPFPADVRSALEKNGLIVTEIAADKPVASTEPIAASPGPDLRGFKGAALAEQILKALGETPVRNADVVLFDHARDGFGLSIMPDLLLEKKDMRFLIHTKNLPEQFVRMLKQERTDVILIAANASGRSLVEGLLRSLNMSVSFGHFSFRIPRDGKRPRLTVTLPALRVVTEGAPLYLIDFDASPDVLSLLWGSQGVRIGKY